MNRFNLSIGLLLLVFAFPVPISAENQAKARNSTGAGQHVEGWNKVCGMGNKISQGCAAVRARTVVDASDYFWSAVGRINYAGAQSRQHCTGVLISERVVLTAAHCLYDHIRNRWLPAAYIHFLSGYQRGRHVGHSRAKRYVISNVYAKTQKPWRADRRLDWAILELEIPLGATSGYLGWSILSSASLAAALRSGAQIALAGYPSVRQHVLSVNLKCKEAKYFQSERLFTHRCAGMTGDSGGPVLIMQNGTASVVSILSGGEQDKNGKIYDLSVPVANFSKSILAVFHGAPVPKKINGFLSFPGRPPIR